MAKPVQPPQLSHEEFTALRLAFADGEPGYDRPALFRQLADTLVPGYFEWHAWTNRVVDVLCRRRWSGFSGASGSAKTYNITGFACLWWLMAPHESSVILCSTSIKMLKKRAWPFVQRFHSALGGGVGNMVDSQTVWQCEQGDNKNAIFGLAVAEGGVVRAAERLKGVHTKRQMVILDEAPAIPFGIWDAAVNLVSGIPPDGEFILTAVANARSRIDHFGRFIEPENGWDSVSPELDEWEGKVRPEDGKRVLVSIFNFKRSPNVLEEHAVSKYLPSKARVTNRLKALKDAGAENDPGHWSNDLGFPVIEGLAKTPFTESLIQKHGGYGRHEFTGHGFTIIGAYDQARTGDRPALRFAAIGEIKPGVIGIELMPAIILYVDASNKDPIAYQLLGQLRTQCASVKYRNQMYNCKPEDLAIDCSNEATFGDLCQREWSPKIHRILFGGAASEEPASHEDERPCNVVYRNKRSEMYFRSKSALESGQLKGIDKDTAAELTTLEYSDLRPDGTTKPITMQDKGEYKKKFHVSPDLADCFVAGTRILTPCGERPIETLIAGDEVITPFGISRIYTVHEQKVSTLTEAYFSNGTQLNGKPRHKIFTLDSGWVALDSLVLTNTVESDTQLWIWRILSTLFTKAENTEFKLMVDTIKIRTGTTRRRDFFIESSGKSITEIFLKACAFITKMVIGKITALRIWNLLRLGNILGFTWLPDFLIPNIAREIGIHFLNANVRLLNGTEVQRGLNGTGRMQSMRGNTKQRSIANVMNAGLFTNTTPVTARSTAPMPVGRGLLNFAITLIKFVVSVAKHIGQASIGRHKVAPVRVETIFVPQLSVFNLTLERDNVYYANGILVDNSAIMILEVARLRGFKLIATGHTVTRAGALTEVAKLADAVFDEATYYSGDNEECEFEYDE